MVFLLINKTARYDLPCVEDISIITSAFLFLLWAADEKNILCFTWLLKIKCNVTPSLPIRRRIFLDFTLLFIYFYIFASLI